MNKYEKYLNNTISISSKCTALPSTFIGYLIKIEYKNIEDILYIKVKNKIIKVGSKTPGLYISKL